MEEIRNTQRGRVDHSGTGGLPQVQLPDGTVMEGHPDGTMGAILDANGQPITGEVIVCLYDPLRACFAAGRGGGTSKDLSLPGIVILCTDEQCGRT